MEYVFNHYYILKHDEKRTILCSHDPQVQHRTAISSVGLA